MVAWNDKYLVNNLGHNVEEFKTDLQYYIANYEAKNWLGLDGFKERLEAHGYYLLTDVNNQYYITHLTGERFMPGIEGAQTSYEHLHRYALASSIVKDKVVLDLACGEGYGPFILSQNAKSVTAVDIDEESVNIAKRKYVCDKMSQP